MNLSESYGLQLRLQLGKEVSVSRNLLARVVVILLIVGVLVGLGPLSALAAPPGSPPAPAPAPAPAPGNLGYYVVQWGETLWSIAQRYGTTVWAIAQANGIWDVNRIRAGQVLVIPGVGHDHPGHHDHGTSYIVQPGDTLSGIAWRFGTTVWAIAQANGIWNHNLIYTYQKLYIP
jgi:putative chitinase